MYKKFYLDQTVSPIIEEKTRDQITVEEVQKIDLSEEETENQAN